MSAPEHPDPPSGWTVSNGALERSFAFPDFAAALAFVTTVAAAAEAANHHPDIAFGWGHASVRWTTHSAGGITPLDFELARRTDQLAAVTP